MEDIFDQEEKDLLESYERGEWRTVKDSVDPYIQNNRALWDEWTQLHLRPEADYRLRIERFQAGGNTLDPIELDEVGDVAGKTLLHLQCHLGLDTLSWARRGAAVTGVDFSAESIRHARAIAAEAGLPAEFLCADVYDLPGELRGRFDIVYTSGGVLTWLPDIRRWAEVVAGCLKTGGLFYLMEFHPFRRVMFPARADADGCPVQQGYFSPGPVRFLERGSYSLPTAESTHTAYYWVHGLGEVVSALCAAGLRIEFLHEFPKVYENFAAYIQTAPGEFEMHVLHDWAVPNTFSIRAARR